MTSAPRNVGTLHVIEPTLEDYAGHCYGLVRSLCDAAKDFKVTLWAGKRAAALEFPANTKLRAHFRRRLRLPQSLWLLRRLLNSSDDPIVLTTAKRADLVLARLAAAAALPTGRLFLYFHWFRESPKRLAFLRRAAAAQPNITILATTESVAATFRAAGFAHVIHLPYPLTATPGSDTEGGSAFRHLLYAGAARQDKGFERVVDLVQLLRDRAMRLPVTIQISAEHYSKYDDLTRAQVRRLEGMAYPLLRLVREPLAPLEYAGLFRGAVCLQPYDRDEFKDRASGVTMDALSAGAPVVATSGTWIARQVDPHGAGVALDNPDATNMLTAVQAIIASYERYTRNALRAGRGLHSRSWEPLLSHLR
jgi:glycosyltransferase involved in cell wall biosynthesis